MRGNPSDEALLAGLESGDRSAATAFTRRFQSRVYGLAWTMLRDRGAAEDVAQEAFLRAWRHSGAYDSRRGRVSTWLLAITRNLALDRLRVKRADPLDPSNIAETLDMTDPGGESDRTQSVSAPVRRAVLGLPEEQRRPLLLATLMGYTAQQISDMDGVPLGTVKTRIRTATISLRGRLEAPDEH
jgi:RNA polymerase sigma-70 factor (ECF subfamily)